MAFILCKVSAWKKDLQQQASTVFDQKRGPKPVNPVEDPEKLYSEIDLLRMELEWLKKKSGISR
jgi:transposase